MLALRSSDSNCGKQVQVVKVDDGIYDKMDANKTEKTIQALASFVISSGISNPRLT